MPLAVRSNPRTAKGLRRADDRVPHLERRAALAHTAGQWLSPRSVFSGASRPVPLAPGCLPGLRPDGGAAFARGGAPAWLRPPSLRPTPLPGGSPPPPKGGSDEGGRELLVEFSAERSLNSTAMV
jgi:hypothetical protein